MPSLPWCQNIRICPKENYIAAGFDNAIVRFFKTWRSEEPQEDHLHNNYHTECSKCPAVDTLSFSNDGLVLLASTRSLKTGTIQVYSWAFPFEEVSELKSCRYPVPLHELEDNGVSSAIFCSSNVADENLVCLTTWTLSGVPVLIQTGDGHKTEIKTEPAGHQGKLGNRIQCACFSPDGRELAMVNDKGHLYSMSSLNSRPLEVRRIATSKDFTVKSDSFAMEFMTLPEEEAIVMAWTDPPKCLAYVKKVPVKSSVSYVVTLLSLFQFPSKISQNNLETPLTPLTPGLMPLPLQPTPRYELPSDGRESLKHPVELNVSSVSPPSKPTNGAKWEF